MRPLEIALVYATKAHWPVFPCKPWPDKRPLTPHGLNDATTDLTQINQWWSRWPNAIPGIPTGQRIGLSVLDVDQSTGGYDTLADDLGFAIWPTTPTDRNPQSGGSHLWFSDPQGTIRNTVGKKGLGIGPGLDWRGTGGYVIPYTWDQHLNFRTTPALPIPILLLPRLPPTPRQQKPVKPCTGLSPYANAALTNACHRIRSAPHKSQETTLNGECIKIGTLAGAGAIPESFARRALQYAASQIPNYTFPWKTSTLEKKVNRAFDYGLAQPRKTKP